MFWLVIYYKLYYKLLFSIIYYLQPFKKLENTKKMDNPKLCCVVILLMYWRNKLLKISLRYYLFTWFYQHFPLLIEKLNFYSSLLIGIFFNLQRKWSIIISLWGYDYYVSNTGNFYLFILTMMSPILNTITCFICLFRVISNSIQLLKA